MPLWYHLYSDGIMVIDFICRRWHSGHSARAAGGISVTMLGPQVAFLSHSKGRRWHFCLRARTTGGINNAQLGLQVAHRTLCGGFMWQAHLAAKSVIIREMTLSALSLNHSTDSDSLL